MRGLTIFFFLLFVVGAANAQTEPAETQGEVLTEIEHMPTFITDCPEGKVYKHCADKAMLEFVYGNLNYPKKAKRQKIEGMVVVSFVVEKNGTVSNAAIYRDIGGGAGEEVLRVVEAMNADGPTWIPGKVNDEPVRVEIKLPVKFKLSKKG